MIKRISYCLILCGLLLSACSPKNAKILDNPVSNDAEWTAQDSSSLVDQPEVFDTDPFENEVEVEIEVEEEIALAPYLMASFRRTSCYGQCPTFLIKLFSDGRAIYHGKQNVQRMGYYEAILNPEQVGQFQDLLVRHRIFDFADQYPKDGNFLADFPSAVIHCQLDGREHTITNNYDCPNSLIVLEQAVESFFENLEWNQLVRINQVLPTDH